MAHTTPDVMKDLVINPEPAIATANEGYETQCFGYPPSTFFEEVKSIINDRLCEGIDLLQQKLLEIPEKVLPRDEVNRGIDTLRQHTECVFTKSMQKMEPHILGNIMKVPPHVLLPSDVDQATEVSAADISLLQAELDSLHLQIKKERYMQAKFKEELEDISSVLAQQKKLIEGDLNTSKISEAEDLKEKLKFIQANATDTKHACNIIQEAIKDIHLESSPSSAQFLSQIAML